MARCTSLAAVYPVDLLFTPETFVEPDDFGSRICIMDRACLDFRFIGKHTSRVDGHVKRTHAMKQVQRNGAS